MYYKVIFGIVLYNFFANGFGIIKPKIPNIISAEDYDDFMKHYLNSMKEDYPDGLTLNYEEALSTELDRQKRSSKCNTKKLYDINSACMCHSGPKKTMVELPMINGDHSGNTLQMPRCIAIERCVSSCPMPTQKCVATNSTKVAIEVSVLGPSKVQYEKCEIVWIDKHISCGCECNMKKEDCTEYQYFDPIACKCRCNLEPDMCKRPKVPNKRKCYCQCPIIKECSSGTEFDENTCECLVKEDNYVDYK